MKTITTNSTENEINSKILVPIIWINVERILIKESA